MSLSYPIHFIIALFLSEVIYFVTSLKQKPLLRFFYAALIPICSYSFLYNHEKIPEDTNLLIITYAGILLICAIFIFLASIQSISQTPDLIPGKFNQAKIVFFALCTSFCSLFIKAIPWAINTFPLDNTDAILFTLFSPLKGAGSFVLSTLKGDVLLKGFLLFISLCTIQIFLTMIIWKRGTSYRLHLFRIKYEIYFYKQHALILIQIQKVTLFILFCYCVFLLATVSCFFNNAAFAAIFQKPTDSPLYKHHYTFPDSVAIAFPQDKRNLIVILMESMETNYREFTPEIDSLEKQNLSFMPGGVSVAGTGWTMSAITAKTCGIPLNLPLGMNENDNGIQSFLPKAKCLTDILTEKGYQIFFAQGSDSHFAQTNDFLNRHGKVQIHDFNYYEQRGTISAQNHGPWGINDHTLYSFVTKELSTITAYGNNVPFVYFITTIDTHQPNGYLCNFCPRQPQKEEDLYPIVLNCASRQISNFLNWAKKQNWYSSTTIVIMGDHISEELSKKVGIPKHSELYWTDIFINSTQKTNNTARKFTSFDMYPTILEAMGAKIEGRKLGLGVSLFSNQPTLLELYGRKDLDNMLRQKSFQYNHLLYGQ